MNKYYSPGSIKCTNSPHPWTWKSFFYHLKRKKPKMEQICKNWKCKSENRLGNFRRNILEIILDIMRNNIRNIFKIRWYWEPPWEIGDRIFGLNAWHITELWILCCACVVFVLILYFICINFVLFCIVFVLFWFCIVL